ncbi:MAG: crossover junction endodeoxyribonuclease RuvC, partial [Litoricola sp.]|nr:crossover junction endodeoxyribonuclease RuvC [Litorivicinus sp.]
KQAICGQGQASKAQMQNMVIRILGLSENPGEDAADALGIALCAGYSKDGEGADARFRLSSRSRSGRRWRLKESPK